MKKLVLLLALLPQLALADSWVGNHVGFNFRATAGFVTDGTNEVHILGNNGCSQTYPQTQTASDGSTTTWGWDFTFCDMARDRSNSVDRRLAGVNQIANGGSQAQFRILLAPGAGTYKVCAALGDENNNQFVKLVIKDNDTTTLMTVDTGSQVNSATFNDANGTNWSAAAWPGSNTCKNVVFTTANLYLYIGAATGGSGANSSTITHLDLTLQSAASTGVPALLNDGGL